MFLKYTGKINKNEIILSDKLISESKIIYKRILLHVGCWKRELSVKYLDDWPANEIGLSKNLAKDFTLPDSIPYKVRFEERNIYLGPVIGLLLVTKHQTLTPEFLSAYKCYLLNYNKVQGLVFIGSSEGINIENQTIKGYFYKPDAEGSWLEGVFPYPDALYRRVGIPNKKYDDLVMHIGDRIFNTYFFDKWELWECLSPYEEIRPHLPYTEKLTDADMLTKTLEDYNTVYLKKSSGQKSAGIYRVIKSDNGYEFISRFGKRYVFANLEKVSKFLQEITQKNGSYLVQQAIKGKEIENRNFDMRVVLQKDQSKEWSCTSMIARFGGTGNITSNIGLGGLAKPGKEALKQIFNLSEEEAVVMEKDIVYLCCKVCKKLNQSIGHYGDLGIDVIIDENRKIWILEVNKLHYHHYPVYALKDKQMYFDTASKPISYASALAGF